MIKSAGIIAAGEGSRLKKAGIEFHKPLIPIAGIPLIAHTLNHFLSAGIEKAVIIFNEQEQECVEWVRGNFPRLQFDFIVKSTPSSFESFWLVGQKLGAGRHLICTVDSICRLPDIKQMLRHPPETATGDVALYLGVTSFVDDEKPLWVEMDEKTGRIFSLGKSGVFATAGFYNVPGNLFEKRPDGPIASLREFLKSIVVTGTPVYGVPLSKVIDIDRIEDIQTAEAFLKTENL